MFQLMTIAISSYVFFSVRHVLTSSKIFGQLMSYCIIHNKFDGPKRALNLQWYVYGVMYLMCFMTIYVLFCIDLPPFSSDILPRNIYDLSFVILSAWCALSLIIIFQVGALLGSIGWEPAIQMLAVVGAAKSHATSVDSMNQTSP